MSAIGDLWLVWLILWVVCYGYVLLNQVSRITRMFSQPSTAFGGFAEGLRSFVLASLAGTVSLVFFAVAILINVTD